MAKLVGKPHAQVGEFTGDCDDRLSAVPAVCAECRQVTRWLERTVSWTSTKLSRFRAIVETILRGHDEILKSLCGFCAGQSDLSTDCECIKQSYVASGLSLTVNYYPEETCPIHLREKLVLETACYVECMPACFDDCFRVIGKAEPQESCWIRDCGILCAPCETITLDPCNDPVHLDMVIRLYNTALQNTNRVGRGDHILAALATLFPGSTPQLVNVKLGVVYVTLGRALTVAEQSFLPILMARVPRGLHVSVELLYPCA